jgi:hypothetical protein
MATFSFKQTNIPRPSCSLSLKKKTIRFRENIFFYQKYEVHTDVLIIAPAFIIVGITGAREV